MNRLSTLFARSRPRILLREGEDPTPNPNPAPAPAPNPAPNPNPTGKTYTDADLNRIVAENKRKLQEKNQTLQSQYETLLNDKNLSDEKRTEYEGQLEALQNESKTTVQQHADAIKNWQKKYDTDTGKFKTESEGWKGKYTGAVISHTLITEATKPTVKAFNPDQLVEYFSSRAKLVPVLGEDSKPTGAEVVKIRMKIVVDGAPKELDLSPADAIAKMKELPEFANYFIDGRTPGLGGGNSAGSNVPVSVKAIQGMTQEQYRKNRQTILNAAG